MVHQRLGDAAGFRDHGNRRAGVAVLREQRRGAAENALPLLVVVVRPRARHGRTLALTVQLVNYYPAVGSSAKTTYALSYAATARPPCPPAQPRTVAHPP